MSKVYKYGVGRTTLKNRKAWEGQDIVFEISPEHRAILDGQGKRANEYYNCLLDIEAKHRTERRELKASLSPELQKLYQEAEVLTAAIQEIVDRIYQIKGPNGYVLTKTKRVEHPEYIRGEEEIEDLREKRTAVWEKARKVSAEVEATHFKEGQERFKEIKQKLVTAYIEEHGKAGPRIQERLNEEARLLCLKDASPTYKEASKLEHQRATAIKEARAKCECFAGVYEAVEAAAKQSIQTSKGRRLKHRKVDSREYTLAVHFRGESKVPVSRALDGSHPWIKITPHPEAFSRASERSQRSDHKWSRRAGTTATLTLKLGDGSADGKPLKSGKKNPVFVDIPIKYHRPLPSDGVITWIKVIVKKQGFHSQVSVDFTIDAEESFAKERNQRRAKAKGTLALHLGWRSTPEGIVVATGWDGKKQIDLKLKPQVLFEGLTQPANLASLRDTCFEQTRRDLVALKFKPPAKLKKLLEERDCLLDNAHLWKAPYKLRTLAWLLRQYYLTEETAKAMWVKWKAYSAQHRKTLETEGTHPTRLFPGFILIRNWLTNQGITDDALVLTYYLDWWKVQDKHLFEWQADLMSQSREHRKTTYREHAAKWASQYEKVVFREQDLGQIAQLGAQESDPRKKKANAIRQLVGIYTLKQALLQTFGAENVIEVKEEAKVFNTHLSCGKVPSNQEELVVHCIHCRTKYDRGLNTARQLYAHECERSGNTSKAGTARKKRETA